MYLLNENIWIERFFFFCEMSYRVVKIVVIFEVLGVGIFGKGCFGF